MTISTNKLSTKVRFRHLGYSFYPPKEFNCSKVDFNQSYFDFLGLPVPKENQPFEYGFQFISTLSGVASPVDFGLLWDTTLDGVYWTGSTRAGNLVVSSGTDGPYWNSVTASGSAVAGDYSYSINQTTSGTVESLFTGTMSIHPTIPG